MVGSCDNHGMQAACNRRRVVFGGAMRPVLRASFLVMLAGGVLSGCASTPTDAGRGGSRSITLYHPGSGETVSVTYRGLQGYDAEALQRIALLFRDRRTDAVAPVDPALIDMLADLRDRCGVDADTPVHITSGYRSRATNVALASRSANVADNSYHIRGQAADITIPGVDPRRLAEEAAAMRRGGYALYPHSGHVHVDTGPYRTWTPKGGEPGARPRVLEARATPPKAAPPRARPAAPAAVPAPEEADIRMILAQMKGQSIAMEGAGGD